VELLWHEYHQAYSQTSYMGQLIDVKLENSSLIMENIEMVDKDGHPPPQEQCYLLYHNQIMFLGQIIYIIYS